MLRILFLVLIEIIIVRLFDEELNRKFDRDDWERTLRRHGIKRKT